MPDGTAMSLPRCNRLHCMPSLDSCTGSIQHRICWATHWVELSCSGDPACAVPVSHPWQIAAAREHTRRRHCPLRRPRPRLRTVDVDHRLRQWLVRKAPERGLMRNPPRSMASRHRMMSQWLRRPVQHDLLARHRPRQHTGLGFRVWGLGCRF